MGDPDSRFEILRRKRKTKPTSGPTTSGIRERKMTEGQIRSNIESKT